MSKTRLDEWLVEAGHYPTRARARDAINRGCVSMGGQVSAKPSRTVTDPNTISINDPAQKWVSRAALKLVSGIEISGFSPEGKIALDIGASTGGFTQVLLENNAKSVFAIDVGQGQMDERIASHPNVTNIEGLNSRDLTLSDLDGASPEFLVCDVSFISLKLALPAALELAAQQALGIFLVKPQFEVGKELIGKGGVVRDDSLLKKTADDLFDWLNTQECWRAISINPSPILGGDGNKEFLLIGEKHA